MKNTAKKLALIALLTASALSLAACDAPTNQDIVNGIANNPIAVVGDHLGNANKPTGIDITPPCVDGCADEVINQLKKIGK